MSGHDVSRWADVTTKVWFFVAMPAHLPMIAVSMIGVQPWWEAVTVASWLLLFGVVVHRYEAPPTTLVLVVRVVSPVAIGCIVAAGYRLPSAA